MALDKTDLQAIENIVSKLLQPIKKDVKSMKEDLTLLASLNQLDHIRRNRV